MHEKPDRREFLVKPVQWAAAAGMLSGLAPSLLAQEPRAAAKLLTRTLGKTGLELPIVSMGVMNANVPGLIRRAHELGIRHFDTAAGYQGGRNEEMVGSMIKELGVRDSVIISTKVHLQGQARTPRAHDVFRQIFEGSLKRLGMDHVDIRYYHSVDSVEDAQAEGPLQALAELKREGKTRFIGISTHQVADVFPVAARLGVFDVGLAGLNFTMASNRPLLAAIEFAAKSGMGVVAMKTQAGGLSRPDPKLPHDLPPHSQTALLKWVLRHPFITTAIPGVTAYPQLEQNMTVAYSLDFNDAEKSFLADKTLVGRVQFCQQCGECLGACPHGVHVPTLMRSHMYAVQYRNRDLARTTLASLEPNQGLSVCAGCAECFAQCRHQVNIAAKISQLKKEKFLLA